MSIFDASKLVTARRVAEHYGIRFGAGGRAFCPFHDDRRHPALSFKDGRYKCFACDAGGDCIDFVAELYGLTPLDAARQINADFGLRLSDEIPTESERNAWAENARQRDDERRRVRQAYNNLCWAERYMRSQAPAKWADMTGAHKSLLSISAEIEAILDDGDGIPEWGWKVVMKVERIRSVVDGVGQPLLGNHQYGA